MLPCCHLVAIWKWPGDGTHRPPPSQTLYPFIQTVLEYGLHQAMDRQRLRIGIATHQRKLAQSRNSCIQLEAIGGNGLKQRTKLRRAIGDDLLKNPVGMKKGAEPQQFGGGSIGLFDLLKRE